MNVNGQDLCRVRLCVAAGCTQESDTNRLLCGRHEKLREAGHHIHLNCIVEHPTPVLVCDRCHCWKPDAEFPPSTRTENMGGQTPDRRGRGMYCHRCAIKRQIEVFKKARSDA